MSSPKVKRVFRVVLRVQSLVEQVQVPTPSRTLRSTKKADNPQPHGNVTVNSNDRCARTSPSTLNVSDWQLHGPGDKQIRKDKDKDLVFRLESVYRKFRVCKNGEK